MILNLVFVNLYKQLKIKAMKYFKLERQLRVKRKLLIRIKNEDKRVKASKAINIYEGIADKERERQVNKIINKNN